MEFIYTIFLMCTARYDQIANGGLASASLAPVVGFVGPCSPLSNTIEKKKDFLFAIGFSFSSSLDSFGGILYKYVFRGNLVSDGLNLRCPHQLGRW